MDYIKVNEIIDRMIGSWAEQGAAVKQLPLRDRIDADNHYAMIRKNITAIAELYGIDFLTDVEYRMKYFMEERSR
jgi:hypothetical protein|nr:MAG TPA: hypothetical protein [Caudoviricetes sp.]